MFSFFQKKVKVEEVEEVEDDIEYTDIIFDDPIAINHNISYYLKDSNKICRFLSSWCFTPLEI